MIPGTNLGGGVGGQTRCIIGKAQVMNSNIYSNVLKAEPERKSLMMLMVSFE